MGLKRPAPAGPNAVPDVGEGFNIMSEHAPIMLWMSDSHGRCVHLNKQLRDFWGVTSEGVGAFDWTSTMHQDDKENIGQAMMAAMARREAVSVKGRYLRADGAYRVLLTNAQPRLSNGVFLGMIGVNTDITEQEAAEAARRRAEADRELMVSELKHRVNNTLSVVQAMARLTFRSASKDAQIAFSERLTALGKSHDLLTQSKQDQVSLRELAATSLQLHSDHGERIAVRGPEVRLHRRETLALGMVLHELFTNALKYGALSNDQGRIALEWAVEHGAASDLRLSWSESGGPTVKPPSRKGFGSTLLERSLQGELGGQVSLDFRPAGIVCSISLRHGPSE